MEKQKYIFLDIDGVLNSDKWYVSENNPGNLNGKEGDLDPECVNRLNNICKETGAKIVLSSDWRISWPYCIDRLENGGINKGLIVDKTPEHMWLPYFSDKSRGSEISSWLSTHECERYVILDDRKDFTEEQWPNFVHIDSMHGLTDEDANLVINILNR